MTEMAMLLPAQPEMPVSGDMVYSKVPKQPRQYVVIGSRHTGKSMTLQHLFAYSTNPAEQRGLGAWGNPTQVTLPPTLSPIVVAFLSAIQPLSQVKRVLVDDLLQTRHILTVISAAPFEFSEREPVYEAQLAALEQARYPTVNFRLINVEELAVSLDAAIPSTYHTVFRRR
jgi:hypothetical protein